MKLKKKKQDMVYHSEFDWNHPAISKYCVELVVLILYSQETLFELVERIQQPLTLFPQDQFQLHAPIEASVRPYSTNIDHGWQAHPQLIACACAGLYTTISRNDRSATPRRGTCEHGTSPCYCLTHLLLLRAEHETRAAHLLLSIILSPFLNESADMPKFLNAQAYSVRKLSRQTFCTLELDRIE
jgi:hypothetical protein